MSDEFSGVDFALGSIKGQRTWRVTVEGELKPVSMQGIWVPGENLAECHAYPSKEVVPVVDGEDYKERNEKIRAWKLGHSFEECQHGFYAYFNTTATNPYSSSRPTLDGVIEGYGEVLIGTKGFRAMKARILALSIAPHDGIWALEPFVIDRIRANYPGVAIFGSTLAMNVEFPADRAETYSKSEVPA